ncbi:MAG: D-alanyl-D-alanine carboxypeptidase family protein [Eubacteriales bacterium]|nr:D-alanyl-D-alanine carboxypeptidase family protein [Eubacteriales bacterium]
MKKNLFRICLSFLCVLLSVCAIAPTVFVFAEGESSEAESVENTLDTALYTPEVTAPAAILMDSTTGNVLYEKNADTPLPPASVTKVMTLLLVMEAIESGKIKLDDMVPVSSHAANMGGSQIYLEEGEEMSVEDMVKSVVIASANDAAAALAEYVAGSEDAFVALMNKRAKELGMNNTNFENTNGLDDTVVNHTISARDIAIMSRELIKYDTILKYSSTWMDSVRGGAFGLTNTNRLVRFYDGATGLKTGSTAKAKFCISATAKRGDLHLIAVIMGADTRDIRNEEAKKLLDYGFSNFALYTDKFTEAQNVNVIGGVSETCKVGYDDFYRIVDKGNEEKTERIVEITSPIAAPIKAGDEVGKIIYKVNGEVIGENKIYALEDVDKISFPKLLGRMLEMFLLRR